MSVEESRQCGCDCMNNDDMCGCEDINTVDCALMEEMAQQIQCCEFAITEISLYLNTHPEDEKALCLHRNYCKEAKELKDKYQKMFGPLTINYPCRKWRWLEEPWPWEGGMM